MNKQLDFLAMGDITTDAFIRLSDAWIETDNPKRERELCMRFADKIPYDFVEVVRAVGNSPNAAVSAARLGLSSGLVTNIGDDENGRECVEVLRKERVDTGYVSTHKGAKTNYHYVLWFQDERTILVKHEAYQYKLPTIEPAPRWLYLSSLGGNSESYHDEIAHYLESHPEVRLAFQPGTFQIKLGKEKLAHLYGRTELFFCNKEEAQKILAISVDDLKRLLLDLNALGPKIVCITDGPKGAYCYDGHMNERWFMPPYPDPKPPLNRTGAGDAFASTFTSAFALGKSIREALRSAPINSAYVVQQIGAQKGLLMREQLEKYLAIAPENYRPRKI
ncbi:MAG TPA: PfkB family carbohydrate kinase [Candidatus Paceibacterota bacterium]